MWILHHSDKTSSGKRWFREGDFQSIAEAARRILELEGKPKSGVFFFEVYIDPLTPQKQDSNILSRLDYQTGKRFYSLERIP